MERRNDRQPSDKRVRIIKRYREEKMGKTELV